MTDYIPKDQLQIGAAYYVSAQHFSYAIWTGQEFAGLVHKFDDTFIDYELHWDDDPPCGTVKPLELLQKTER